MRIWLTLWRCAPLLAAAALAPVPFALSGTVPWTLPMALAGSAVLLRFGSKSWVDWRAARLGRLLRETPAVHPGLVRAHAVDAWEVQTVMRRRFGLADAVTDPDEEALSAADSVHFVLSPSDDAMGETAPDALDCSKDREILASAAIMFRCPDVHAKTRSSP